MPSNDGSVEIRITGSVDPSVAASTNAAKAAMADLSSAATTLTFNQQQMAAAVRSGAMSLDQLQTYLGKSETAVMSFGQIARALAAEQIADTGKVTAAVEAATFERISLTKEEGEALGVALASAKQRSAEGLADDAATVALRLRMAKQQSSELMAAAKAAASEDQSLAASTLAFKLRMAKQQASEELAVAKNAARESAANDAAVLSTRMRMNKQEAAAADDLAARRAKLIAGISPLAAAEQRLATVTAEANALAAEGAISEEVQAAAIAAATKAVEAKTTAEEKEVVVNGILQKLTSGRSIYEAEAAGRAILTGNSGRLASALAVEAARLNLVKYAFTGTGAAVVALTAVVAASTVAGLQYAQAQQQLTATTLGLGAAAGQTTDQLNFLGKSAAAMSGEAVSSATDAAAAFASAGVKSEAAILKLSANVQTFAQLTGQKAAEAQRELAKAMEDPTKGAEDLNSKLSILDSTQLEQIRTLQAAGDKEGAVDIITKALQRRFDEAHQAGVGLNTEFDNLVHGAQDLWTWLGQVNQQLEIFSSFGLNSGKVQAEAGAARGTAVALAQADAQRNKASDEGAQAYAGTPEGRAAREKSELEANLTKARNARAADSVNTASHPYDAEAVNRDKIAIEDYTRAIATYRTEAEKKVATDELDVKISAAKRAHNAALVDDLTRQKSLVSQSGTVESYADANRLSQGAGDAAGARGGAGRKPKDDQVQQWREQLEAKEIISTDYFLDETQDELKFWQDKVALTTKGSHDWLEVQRQVFDLSKALAHQNADITREVVSSVDEESRKDEEKRFNMKREAANEQIAELKSNLSTSRSIREADAKQQEAEIQAKAKYGGPLAEISADKQIAAIHRETAQQNMTDMDAEHVLQDKVLQDDINAAHKGTEAYQKAVDAKKLADLQFYNQHRALEDQMVNQSRADAERIKASWHSTIDPMVQTTGTQIKGLVEGTETWSQALKNVGESAINLVIQAIEKMVEAWIVNMVTQQAAGKAGAQGTVQALAGQAGAGGVASMAAAPFPLDLGAPAFGAAMEATAMAFGSFAKGVDVVPNDMIAQVHAGERIMTSADNAGLAGLISGGGSKGGDTIINHSPTFNGIGGDAKTAADMSHKELTKRVEKMQRRGMLGGKRR